MDRVTPTPEWKLALAEAANAEAKISALSLSGSSRGWWRIQLGRLSFFVGGNKRIGWGVTGGGVDLEPGRPPFPSTFWMLSEPEALSAEEALMREWVTRSFLASVNTRTRRDLIVVIRQQLRKEADRDE